MFSIVDGFMSCFNISMVDTAASLKIPLFGVWAVFLLSVFSPAVQPPQRDPACATVSIPYEEVQPIAMALQEAAPVELRRNEANALAKAWPVWVARHRMGAQELAHDTGGRRHARKPYHLRNFISRTTPLHTIGHGPPCQTSF